MEIIEMIELEYDKPVQRHTVWVIILAFIHHTFNNYLTQLERHPPPTVASGPATGMPMEAPRFNDVYEFLGHGRIKNLTKIPECLLVDRSREDTPPIRPNSGNKNPSGPGANDKNKMPNKDCRPDQNPELKKAWLATGKKNVFSSDSPFYDPTALNSKVLIMSDTHGMRICLPQCLKGFCYKNCGGKHGLLLMPEVKHVADKGGLKVEGL